MKNMDLRVHATRDFDRAKTKGRQRNLVQDIVDECVRKRIDICTVTNLDNGHSELIRSYIENLPEGYTFADIGRGVYSFKVDEHPDNIYLIESHVQRVNEGGISFDCLVVGRSSNMTDGLVKIITNPNYPNNICPSKVFPVLNKFDAIEVYGAHSDEKVNDLAESLAYSFGWAGISSSGAKRIRDIGDGYTLINDSFIDYGDGNGLLNSLRDYLKERRDSGISMNYDLGLPFFKRIKSRLFS